LEPGLDYGNVVIHQEAPTPTQFTPQVARYVSIAGMRLTTKFLTASTWEISLTDPNGRSVAFSFPSGSAVSTSHQKHYTLRLLSATGADVFAGSGNPAPARIRLEYASGGWTEFDYNSNLPLKHRTVSGRITDLASLPAALKTDVIYHASALRQIKAMGGLLDFVQDTSQAFEMRFYAPDQVGALNTTTGLYALTGTAYRVVRFSNASTSANDYGHVKVTETWGDQVDECTYDYNEALKEWGLTEGNASLKRIEFKSSVPGPAANEMTIRNELKDENNTVISTTHTIRRSFPWGGEVVQVIKEPSILNLSTLYAYHETEGQPGYKQLKHRQEPDGSWVSYTYDGSDRIITQSRPWKDSDLSYPLTAPRRITSYDYTALESGDSVSSVDKRPRTVTESVVTVAGGTPVVVGRTWHVYKTDAAQGIYTEIEERAATASATYGAAGNLRTTRVYYTTLSSQSGYDAASAGFLRQVDYPDGTRIAYVYTRDNASTDAYWTTSERRVSVAQPDGIDGLSTRVDRIFNQRGQHLKTERYLRANAAWNKYETETMAYNVHGRHLSTALNGRTIYSASYRRFIPPDPRGPSPETGILFGETDETGRTKRYSYDALGKLESVTQVGVPASGSYAAQPDIVTTYLRELGGLSCGCDGEVITTLSAGSLSLETTTKKDGVGRLTYQKDAAGLVTSYFYQAGGREVVRLNPDGGTVISLNYVDRRPRSITGSGAVVKVFDYGVDPDGTKWTKVSGAGGDRWTKTTTNHLGQLVKIETPGQDGVLKTVYSYNAKGQLWRTRQSHVQALSLVETSAVADVLFEYDGLGNNWRSGSDLNGNGVLDLASADRITDSVRSFSWQDFAWWKLMQSKVYPTLNSNAAVQVSETRSRLSGFSGALVAETRVVDIDGNLASEQVEVDPTGKLVTTKLKSPDSPLFAVSVRRNGLLVSQSTTTVAAPVLYSYDALGRVLTIKEPRHTQASSYAYHGTTGHLIGLTDAVGNATTYAYYGQGEAGAGRVKLVTNALGHTQRTAYDLIGRVTRKWGSASYPQAYAYSVYGDLTTLTTWRDTAAANLDQATWPALPGGDVTTWTFQGSTGLWTRKQYADGKGTDYTYDKFNRLATRTWARSSSLPAPGSLLTTTYLYASGTGKLETINYSDDTPDVSSTYDRLGRPLTVTDATGTRSFAYDPTKLRLDTETLPAGFYGARVLKRDYQGSASGEIPGRVRGYQLGTVADPDQDFALGYGYDGFGRLNGVTSPAGRFDYDYVGSSDLLYKLTSPVHVATRAYEPDRDVLDTLESSVGASTVSKFDYTVNSIGQRTLRAQTGTAFAGNSTDVFGYNTKGEVTGATNAILSTRNQAFSYDQIGNRLSLIATGGTTSYTSNSLNQYTQVSGFSSQPSYDFDGNQTATGLGQAYIWDAENRLVAVEPVFPATGDKRVLNTYDAECRRVRRQTFTYTSGTWALSSDEKFVYDGWNVVAVLDAASGNAVLRTYTWGKDLSGSIQGAGGVGGLLAVKDGAAVYHYTYDANGNVSEVLSNSGSIVAHYEYTAFGGTFVISGAYASTNEYRFSTKPWDAVSGLYYYGFRYYSPSLGAWLGRDPAEEEGGMNLYGFLCSDSINSFDILGLAGTNEAEEILDGSSGGSSGFNNNEVVNQAVNCPSRPTLVHNEKHHMNSESPEPDNVEELYETSVYDSKNDCWYSIDQNGDIHRFSKNSNGTTHWNGSTATSRGLHSSKMPSGPILRLLQAKLKR
jgi:RHS repeat-associated protein